MAEFLEMGGYARYVWPAYGAFALILAGLAIWTWRRSVAARRTLAEIEAREARPDVVQETAS